MYRIRIEIEGDFIEHAYRAIVVETKQRISERYNVRASLSDKLVIDIEAEDLTALRAAMNTYFRRLDMIIALYKIIGGAGGIRTRDLRLPMPAPFQARPRPLSTKNKLIDNALVLPRASLS